MARFVFGLIPRMWIESQSPSSSAVPGRESLPRIRMKIGSFPVSVGPYSAWASPICISGTLAAGVACSVATPSPETPAASVATAAISRRRITMATPTGSWRRASTSSRSTS